MNYPYTIDRQHTYIFRKAISMIDLQYPNILNLFPKFIATGRNESASFLIWYLQNYYRFDDIDAIDSVCDICNDRGIDGVFVNDNDKTITIFQSRIFQGETSTIGDRSLREFAGTLTQFDNQESIQNLLNTANEKVVALLKRADVINKILTHEIRGEFVSNIDTDANGKNFLRTANNIEFVGKTVLTDTYISGERESPIHDEISLDIGGFRITEYTVDANTKAFIAPIKATQLVTMEGISNQSLFYYNVRGSLGKTSVNKEIELSIRKPDMHKLFPLFHNGITIVSSTVNLTSDTLVMKEYFVVNGCQSLSALYKNRACLTDDLRILVKIIQLEPNSDLAKKITEYSNNQNGVRERDFKANDKMQIRLQSEFRDLYKDQFFYEIKRGELHDSGESISNEYAGLLLMSFDLKEPWATHRKYQVFDEKHSSLFGRKEVTADRIVLLREIGQSIERGLSKMQNKLVAKYTLTHYVLVYIVRNILETDPLILDILQNPSIFVREVDARTKFAKCVDRIVGDIITDMNLELKDLGENFDYHDKLRDEAWIKNLNKAIVSTHNKLVERNTIQTFAQEWNS